MKHLTLVLAAIPALFLATTAGAATFTIQKIVVNNYFDNSRPPYVSNPEWGRCDVVSSFFKTTTCSEEFNLSLPDVEFSETHYLDSIAVGVGLATRYNANIGGYDPDWGAVDDEFELFADYRIDATLQHRGNVQFTLESALGDIYDYAKSYDLSVRCQSDNSDLLVLGDGLCANSSTVQVDKYSNVSVFSGFAIDMLMSEDLVLKYERSARDFVGDQDDDSFFSGNSFSSSFSLNLTYTYVDKPVVSPPDMPTPSVVPLPAGLPLLATSLMALGILKRRKTGSRTIGS